MSKNVDIDRLTSSGLASGQPVQQAAANQINDDICNKLDQVFDLIFTSSKQVLGNISSLGIRYGRSFDSPDHMLILFSNEVVGFEEWNNTQRKRLWRYQKASQRITANGVEVTHKKSQKFVDFVKQGLVALNDQKVMFSKNITKNEIKQVR